jgi:ribose 5-phosphate isomerase B
VNKYGTWNSDADSLFSCCFCPFPTFAQNFFSMDAVFDFEKPIAIGSDHAGFAYKSELIGFLRAKGFPVKDFGTHSADSTDYPDFAHPVAAAVESSEATVGILVCGSANGVAITANKHQGIRAAICWLPEIASLARQHNNANVLCLPARFVTVSDAQAMVETFLSTAFEGGRHQNRVDKIACI